MKKHILIVTVMSALPICVAAQQNDLSGSSSSPRSTSASDRQPIPTPASHDFWDGDDPSFGSLITHPFASKKYVQRHTGPIRDRVNELEQLTSENATAIKDVDSRAQQGIRLASEKSSLADQHAADATNKSQMAQNAATQASTRVGNAEQLVAGLDQYKDTAQTEIHFRPGQNVLSKTAKDALDEIAGPLKNQHSYIVEVRGFASGKGHVSVAASRAMADSVVRYLVLTHQIPVYRIYTMSMGNGAGPDQKRGGARVEVTVLRNELVSTTQR